MRATPSRPLVSVITPFLDAAPFLDEAIRSVRAQTWPRWELLLVDDGSRDGSTAIARAHAEADPTRIRYLAHPDRRHQGQSVSRNLGFAQAQGDYVAYLDADDVWLPDKLEHQLALLDAHPEAGMVMSASLYWLSWSVRAEDRAADFVVPIGAPAGVVPPPRLLTLLYPLGKGAAPCPTALMVRRDVVEAVGGWEASFAASYTDQPFLAKIYLRYPVFVDGACTDRYRQHATSVVSTMRRAGTYRTARRRYLDWLQAHLAASNIRDRAIERALERALWPYRHPHLAEAIDVAGGLVRAAGSRLLPAPVRHRLRRRLRGARPPDLGGALLGCPNSRPPCRLP